MGYPAGVTFLKRALVAALVVLLVAVVLAPMPGTARADEGGTVTTVLHPGFNLVGWIEPEAGVGELFATLPQLRAIHAWDAEAERFRTASSGSEGDLATLEPGMGLWFEIDGTSAVDWTRKRHR